VDTTFEEKKKRQTEGIRENKKKRTQKRITDLHQDKSSSVDKAEKRRGNQKKNKRNQSRDVAEQSEENKQHIGRTDGQSEKQTKQL
jgi:hypothetical protein